MTGDELSGNDHVLKQPAFLALNQLAITHVNAQVAGCSWTTTRREASLIMLFRLRFISFYAHCVCHGTAPGIPPHASRSLFPLARTRCAPAHARHRRRGAACSGSGLRSRATPGG